MRVSTVIISLIGGLLFAVAGCRTYGGHNSEARIHEALRESVRELESEVSAAEASLQQLEAAAKQVDDLSPLVHRYETLVHSHQSLVRAQEETVTRLSEESSHRALSRAYGAVVTDQRLLHRQYDRTVREVYAVVRDTLRPTPPLRDRSTYSITPVNYPVAQREITMIDALRPVEGAPGLRNRGASGE